MINQTVLTAVRSSARRSSPHRHWATRAFSIPQLLSYSVASSLLLVLANVTLLSSIRSNNSMEFYQRAEERWSRISGLIQSETSEANEIRYNQNIVCLGSSSGGTAVWSFTLQIPFLDSVDNTISSRAISYTRVGSGSTAEVRRCGSGYNADGTHIGGNNTLSTVGMRTEMVITNPAADSFTYTLNFYTPSNQLIFSRSATATVGFVCDRLTDPTCPS
jgi:hypothetical protein